MDRPKSPAWSAWAGNLIDPALLRPGRLDELIYVSVPNAEGRKRILEIQTGKMPLADDVDLGVLAEKSDRFTGADLPDRLARDVHAGLAHTLQQRDHFRSASS